MTKHIQEVFWLTSADAQQLLYVSPSFEATWCRPCESLYTYPGGHRNLIIDSIHPNDRERIVASWATQTQAEYKAEYRIVRPDGSIRWVRSRSFPVQNSFGETWGIAGFSEDITECKHSEEILHQREQQFRTLVEHSPDIIARFDRQLRYLYVSPAVEAETGQPPEDYLGKTFGEVGVPEPLLSLSEQSLHHVFQTGQYSEIEFSFSFPNELKYYQSRFAPEFAADGSVESVLEICRDITKNKQTEVALRESEERFRTVFDFAPIGIAVISTKRMLYQANQAFQEMLGYTPEELQHLSFIEFTHPDDREESIKLFEELLLGQRTHFSSEKRYFRKDGRLVWGKVLVSAIYDSNGLFHYAIAMLQDISEHKQIELELFNARDELEQRVAERTAELKQANIQLQQEIAERVSVQEALKTQKEFLQTVIDLNPNRIFVKDREGKYTLANKACADFHGITVEDLLGHTDAQLKFNSADVELFVTEDLEVLTTLQPKFFPEVPCHSPTGEMRWYQVIKQPLISKDGEGCQVFGVCTDITERKFAEEQLRQREAQLRLALDAANMGFWDWNLQTGKVTRSSNLERLYGWVSDLSDETKERFFTILHPDDHQLLKEADRRAIETGEDYSIEFRILLPDGSIRWLESKGQVFYDEFGKAVQMTGVNLDISDRKFAEEQLRQSETLLHLALEAANMGFWDWNLQTGKVIRSPSLERMFGWQPNTTHDTNDAFLKIIHPDDRELLQKTEEHIIKTGEAYNIEFRIILPDKSIRWLESKGQVIYDESRKPTRITGIDLDISERKLAEIKIKESLREKEVLLQEIHHRVKNNLQVISSLLDLQSQHIYNQAMLEIFRESQSRIRSMALVHEKLYQSRDCAKINFADYVCTLTSYLFQVYGVKAENITLNLHIDDISLNIDTAIPCGLIINELISNSLKYAFPNRQAGVIDITFESKNNGQCTLVVQDNGVGLPMNLNLYTAKTLGLKLVNVLTKQLEGMVEFYCQNGTRFSIKFLQLSD